MGPRLSQQERVRPGRGKSARPARLGCEQYKVCFQPFVNHARQNVPLGRFNRIVWGKADGNRPEGVIAAGMETGELTIWDPSKIVAHVKFVACISCLCGDASDMVTPAPPRLFYSRIVRIPDLSVV
jgi:hypothetical protein